jgi:uncharacterized protein YndB with AHSA1/START domain
MKAIEVKAFIEAPIERVFDAVSDHEQFFTGGNIVSCRVIQPGTPERNGVGCRREVKTAQVFYVEEITEFQRPTRFAYQLRETNLPLEHGGSQISFVSRDGGTEVTWTAKIALKGAEPQRTDAMREQVGKEFERMLLQAKAKLAKK